MSPWQVYLNFWFHASGGRRYPERRILSMYVFVYKKSLLSKLCLFLKVKKWLLPLERTGEVAVKKLQQKHLSPSKNLFMSGGDIRRESNTNTIIVNGMIIVTVWHNKISGSGRCNIRARQCYKPLSPRVETKIQM